MLNRLASTFFAVFLKSRVETGSYSTLVRTRDSQSFNRLHAEQLLYLPGVRQIRSFMGLREVMSTHKVPI
ncbi:MAG: hypothetical protein ACTH69_09350 [Halomonas sp.]|uniref:hypothetical protein n=1 Tax=Halomonas sp. TaxID=1486246 RepID=UPI003F8ECEAE